MRKEMSLNFDDASQRHGRITIDFDAKKISDVQIELLASIFETTLAGRAGIPQLGTYKVSARIYDSGHRRFRTLNRIPVADRIPVAKMKDYLDEYLRVHRENKQLRRIA